MTLEPAIVRIEFGLSYLLQVVLDAYSGGRASELPLLVKLDARYGGIAGLLARCLLLRGSMNKNAPVERTRVWEQVPFRSR
jgi:hypothetical protein